MMKQWQFNRSGKPRDILKMVEVPIPNTCRDDEVLVKVSHVSLNTSITDRLMAYYSIVNPLGALMGKPAVPEVEFSGIVCDLRGDNVKGLNTGDRVLGFGPAGRSNIINGVLRKYIVVKRDNMVKVPENISLKEASYFPAAGSTAYYYLVEVVQLKEGDKVFITGGSGSIGVLFVQLARHLVGSTGVVVATCSPLKSDAVRRLGADQVIDYTSHNLPEYLREHYSSRPFDAIFDIVGNDHALYSNSPSYLTEEGVFCTVGVIDFGSTVWLRTKRIFQLLSGIALPVYMGGVPRRFVFQPVDMVQSRMLAMAKLIEDGTFKAVIDSTYQFTNALDAYDRLMSRQVIGRVVIEVNQLEE